ncbi:s-adenosylmethionine synthetase [Holotrichia oblita]|nr:s-adenosylmethionine synthetase [Holotrichia oblita]
MNRAIKIDDNARNTLKAGIFEGNVFKLTQQLSRSEYDNVNKVLTALGAKWDRKSKGHIFDYDIRQALDEAIETGKATDWKKETNFFYTPEPIVHKMLGLITYPTDTAFTLLEPSAGQGHILDVTKQSFPNAIIKSVEINPNHCEVLRDKGYDVICDDFINVEPFPVDIVLMNPPFDFEKEHIRHAYEFLKNGGVLISITSEGLWFRETKKFTEFRDWFDSVGGVVYEKLPQNAFRESGTSEANMKLTAKYTFQEDYIPPHCRKTRQREVEKTVNITIREIGSELAPVAMITTTWESRKVAGQKETVFGLTETVYRWFRKKLFTPCICQSGDNIGTQYTISDVMYRINQTGYSCDSTEKERLKQIKKNAGRYLLIDGILYETCGEPRYVINTFGLGHNHGGTGFFVERYYNQNIGKNNYFSAFQREEAIEYFKRVALGRGDTNSVKDEEQVNIKVLIPEAVKCNPQSEHGDGCAFMNSLESMVSGSKNVTEAGFMAVALALSESASQNKGENAMDDLTLSSGDFQCPDTGEGVEIIWNVDKKTLHAEPCTSGIWDGGPHNSGTTAWCKKFGIHTGINSAVAANAVIDKFELCNQRQSERKRTKRRNAMAKIKGYELKKVETWTGREGYGLNADIYCDGKKVGAVTDDASGGEVDLEFVSQPEKDKINEAAEKYFKETNDYEEYKDVLIEEFINAILDLRQAEKEYKKFLSKGLPEAIKKLKFKGVKNMIRVMTAESVTEGHPDKLADLIADSILDECLAQDKLSRVACEVMLTKGKALIAGEITTTANVNYIEIAKSVIREVGYETEGIDFECRIHIQSPDIKRGVDASLEVRDKTELTDEDALNQLGAGDQGIVYGYAINETPNLMPLCVNMANAITERLTLWRKKRIIEGLMPDGKAQVTLSYENNKLLGVLSIIVSTQHKENVSVADLRADIKMLLINDIFPHFDLSQTEILINPAGAFVCGGFEADTGLTGRKTQVDSYGGIARFGGGAFSGKDPSKVDRSGAYMARYIARHIVKEGFADACEIAISYAIGKAQPTALDVCVWGSRKLSLMEIKRYIINNFDLRPAAIIEALGLHYQTYKATAVGGHFGRDEFSWEK